MQGMISQQNWERAVFKTKEGERRRHKLASPSIALNMHVLPYPVSDLSIAFLVERQVKKWLLR